MSREIKFKFWLVNVKRFMDMQNFLLCCEKGDYNLCKVLAGKDKRVKPLQLTGLKDKDGVDIYEGDVVRAISVTEPVPEFCNHVVEYHNARCALMAREVKENHRGGRYWEGWDFLRETEVIGNIHENPDLLKELER